MSDFINANNLDQIVDKNKQIKKEIEGIRDQFYQGPFYSTTNSFPQLCLSILKERGLIQLPISDKYWNGAIYVQEGKIIPIINTAQIRANQYFTIWHEVYHLIFEKIETTHQISILGSLQERKADLFAAKILLNDLEKYYSSLSDCSLEDKVYYCMDYFQVPYKAVLISLFEFADATNNTTLKDHIKNIFDNPTSNLEKEFNRLGLDDNLVKPSNVINVSYLQNSIKQKLDEEPELRYHHENEQFLNNILTKFRGNK